MTTHRCPCPPNECHDAGGAGCYFGTAAHRVPDPAELDATTERQPNERSAR